MSGDTAFDFKFKKVIIDIKAIREELELSQSEFADMLGVSPRTVQSCEQQWRKPGAALERTALLLLLAHRNGSSFGKSLCWKEAKCPPERRKECITYHSRQGHLCWLMNGTFCHGLRLRNWQEKLSFCMKCRHFQKMLKGKLPTLTDAN